MATNHTTNYQLNLWEPTDSFLREEFNENFGKLDAAVAACVPVTGTYIGSRGESEQHIVLGFRPRLVLFMANRYFGAKMDGCSLSFVDGSSSAYISTNDMEFVDDGFIVDKYETNLSNKGVKYSYIAFR